MCYSASAASATASAPQRGGPEARPHLLALKVRDLEQDARAFARRIHGLNKESRPRNSLLDPYTMKWISIYNIAIMNVYIMYTI